VEGQEELGILKFLGRFSNAGLSIQLKACIYLIKCNLKVE